MSFLLLTVEQSAAYLHGTVSVKAVRAMIRSGELPARKIGRRWYVNVLDLEKSVCPEPVSRPASGKITKGGGSSSTKESSTGLVSAEQAVEYLLRQP